MEQVGHGAYEYKSAFLLSIRGKQPVLMQCDLEIFPLSVLGYLLCIAVPASCRTLCASRDWVS